MTNGKYTEHVKERMRNMLDIDERQCAYSYTISFNCLMYRKMMIFHDDDDEVGKDDVFSQWTVVLYPKIHHSLRMESLKGLPFRIFHIETNTFCSKIKNNDSHTPFYLVLKEFKFNYSIEARNIINLIVNFM